MERRLQNPWEKKRNERRKRKLEMKAADLFLAGERKHTNIKETSN